MDFYKEIEKDLVYWAADNISDINSFLNAAIRALKEKKIKYIEGKVESVKTISSEADEQNQALLKALDYYRYNIKHIDKVKDPHTVLGSCIILLNQLTEEYQELIPKLGELDDPEVYNEILESLVTKI